MRTVNSDQTGWMPSLIWDFAGYTDHFVGIVVLPLSFVCYSSGGMSGCCFKFGLSARSRLFNSFFRSLSLVAYVVIKSKKDSISVQDQDQDSLLVKRRNDNHSPGPVIRELVPSSHQRSELSNTILCIFSGWDRRIGEGIPIPDSLGEEATFINICIGNGSLKCHRVLIPTTPSVVQKHALIDHPKKHPCTETEQRTVFIDLSIRAPKQNSELCSLISVQCSINLKARRFTVDTDTSVTNTTV